MVKILQVCHEYYPHIGGVETHVKEISERLVAKGYDVTVLTTCPRDDFRTEEVINGVNVRRFRSWAPNGAYYFSSSLKKYLAENSKNYDIIHAHNYHAFPALYAVQAKGKNKLVFTGHYHGTAHSFIRKILFKPYQYIANSIFKRADKVICVSNYEKKLVAKKVGISEKKIIVIPNGVNLGEFKHQKKMGSKKLLYVGRLEKYKGIQYLLRSLPYLDQDVFLDIVGKGPYEDALLDLVKTLGIASRVKFHHDLPRTELIKMYTNAGLFVLLSSNESFGLSVAEALAAKTPCIVANTSALIEWVDNKNCFGLNYPPAAYDTATLIKSTLGKTVRNATIADWNGVVNRLISCYENVLSTEITD